MAAQPLCAHAARGSAMNRIDFARINAAALPALPALLARWLPNGQHRGREYVALDPNRADQRPGSFRINIRTGAWADFATGDRGGDPVSLAAYVFNISATLSWRSAIFTQPRPSQTFAGRPATSGAGRQLSAC